MGRPRKFRGFVRAKEPIVVNVGGRPPEWRTATVRNKRTDRMEEVVLNDVDPIDEGDPGVPYAFKANERVRSDHPAVVACPGAFAPIEDELDDE